MSINCGKNKNCGENYKSQRIVKTIANKLRKNGKGWWKKDKEESTSNYERVNRKKE